MGKYFGTDGIRGLAGETLTATQAYRIGRFLGAYQQKRHRIILGMDTRISSTMLISSLIAGITATGSDVIDLGVITTPAISYLLAKHDCTFGVMVSASHNPYYDNGIKIFNAKGEKLDEKIEDQIEIYMDGPVDVVANKTSQDIGTFVYEAKNYQAEYLDFLVSKKTNDFAKLKILVDCANGSASVLIGQLMQRLGVQADFIHAQPNGVNINERCGATHLQSLSATIKKGKYDIGFALDGDGDRMLAVNERGDVIDGDDLLYVFSQEQFSNQPHLQRQVVITSMANLGLKKWLQTQQCLIHETQVGDKYVRAKMVETQTLLGGEQSGHIIFLNDLSTGDGLLALVKLLNIIAKVNQPVSKIVQGLVKYPQLLKNHVVVNKKAVMTHPGLKSLVDSLQQQLGDHGRVLVRASGTESIVRVMVEATSLKVCQDYADQVIQFIDETFLN